MMTNLSLGEVWYLRYNSSAPQQNFFPGEQESLKRYCSISCLSSTIFHMVAPVTKCYSYSSAWQSFCLQLDQVCSLSFILLPVHFRIITLPTYLFFAASLSSFFTEERFLRWLLMLIYKVFVRTVLQP